MKTTLILIRHGLTDWNAEGRWQGHEDIPLNETGIAQAQALAGRLASWPIEILYSSDLKRAAQTASIVGSALGMQPILDPTWRERDVGAFQGLTRAEIELKFPQAFSKKEVGIVDHPSVEDSHALYDRAVDAYRALVERHAGQVIAVVTHGGFLHTILLHVLGLPVGHYSRLSLRGNTGISTVEISNGQARLTRLNDTAHLEAGGTNHAAPDLTHLL